MNAPRQINCRDAVEHIYEYLDRELTPEAQAEVERHLKGCIECGHHLEFERAFLRFLEARARGRGAGPDVKRRILRELFEAEDA